MQAGDYVLLEGTGGVSVFGLQFAVAAGAKPIITSSSDDKLVRAKSLGAVGGVNYKTNPDWEKPVRELTGGGGVQHVLEVGGKDTLAKALASVGPGGQIALIGGLGGFGGTIQGPSLLGGNITVNGLYVGSRENFEAMNAFIEKHKIKPVIDKVLEFSKADAAYQLMESGDFMGKIVIRM
jgi:NADPH:quinone reductase-like Zn-dependent oxidoreductase